MALDNPPVCPLRCTLQATRHITVLDGENEDQVPYCLAFEEIGKTFGGFDFAMIPIGYVQSGRLILLTFHG